MGLPPQRHHPHTKHHFSPTWTLDPLLLSQSIRRQPIFQNFQSFDYFFQCLLQVDPKGLTTGSFDVSSGRTKGLNCTGTKSRLGRIPPTLGPRARSSSLPGTLLHHPLPTTHPHSVHIPNDLGPTKLHGGTTFSPS